jgi:hypothetical protein
MKAEIWENEYGDIAIFVGEQYVLYDNKDKKDIQCIKINEKNNTLSTEEMKISCYEKGFRPLPEKLERNIDKNIPKKCEKCTYGKHCNDKKKSKICTSCMRQNTDTSEQHLKDNFELFTIHEYELKLKNKNKGRQLI